MQSNMAVKGCYFTKENYRFFDIFALTSNYCIVHTSVHLAEKLFKCMLSRGGRGT